MDELDQVCAIARRENGNSFVQAAIESPYAKVRPSLSIKVLAARLRLVPSYLHDWDGYLCDQRCDSGFSLSRRWYGGAAIWTDGTGSTTVARFLSLEAACAFVMLRMLDGVMAEYPDGLVPRRRKA